MPNDHATAVQATYTVIVRCTIPHAAQSLTQSISILPSYWKESPSKLKILSLSFKPGLIKNQAEVPLSPYTIKLGP